MALPRRPWLAIKMTRNSLATESWDRASLCLEKMFESSSVTSQWLVEVEEYHWWESPRQYGKYTRNKLGSANPGLAWVLSSGQAKSPVWLFCFMLDYKLLTTTLQTTKISTCLWFVNFVGMSIIFDLEYTKLLKLVEEKLRNNTISRNLIISRHAIVGQNAYRTILEIRLIRSGKSWICDQYL